MRKRLVVSVATLICSSPCAAQQTSLADQKTQTDIAKESEDIAKERADLLKEELDQIQSVKGVANNTTTLSSQNASAEAGELGSVALRGAADRVADQVHAWMVLTKAASQDVLVVVGGNRPTVADYLAFDRTAGLVKDGLDIAIASWNVAYEAHKTRSAAKQKSVLDQFMHIESQSADMVPAAGGGLPVLGAVGTVAGLISLFNVDREVAGSSYASNDSQMAAMMQAALRRWNVEPDIRAFEIDTAPQYVTPVLAKLDSDYRTAEGLYTNEYLPALAKAGGKLDSEPDLAAAGASLATATSDYRALVARLYTPVNGTLPAAEIDRQKRIADAAKSTPILYIRDYQSALTSITKHGFLVGLIGRTSTPVTLKAAAQIDYTIVMPQLSRDAAAHHESATAFYSTGPIPFDQIDALTCSVADRTDELTQASATAPATFYSPHCVVETAVQKPTKSSGK